MSSPMFPNRDDIYCIRTNWIQILSSYWSNFSRSRFLALMKVFVRRTLYLGLYWTIGRIVIFFSHIVNCFQWFISAWGLCVRNEYLKIKDLYINNHWIARDYVFRFKWILLFRFLLKTFRLNYCVFQIYLNHFITNIDLIVFIPFLLFKYLGRFYPRCCWSICKLICWLCPSFLS